MVKMAGKDFTTLRAIEQMRELCHAAQKALDSCSNAKSETPKGSSRAAPHGSFETERAAQAALEQTAKALNKPSRNTSPESIRSRETAVVIRLKS
jgi:hypothetical protein